MLLVSTPLNQRWGLFAKRLRRSNGVDEAWAESKAGSRISQSLCPCTYLTP